MTEHPDTAAIRARRSRCRCEPCKDAMALCDALDAARAKEFHHRELVGHLKGRAEVAEADRDNWCDCAVHWRRARDRRKARIEAVRAVLDAHGPDGMNSAGYDLWSDVNHALLP